MATTATSSATNVWHRADGRYEGPAGLLLSWHLLSRSRARGVVDVGLARRLPAQTTAGRLCLCLLSAPGQSSRFAHPNAAWGRNQS
jgi:hypothetical protein